MSDLFCKRVQRREEDMSIYVCVKKKCMQLWQTSVLRATNPTHRGGGTAPKRAECQGGKKTGGSPVSCKQPPADRPTPPPSRWGETCCPLPSTPAKAGRRAHGVPQGGGDAEELLGVGGRGGPRPGPRASLSERRNPRQQSLGGGEKVAGGARVCSSISARNLARNPTPRDGWEALEGGGRTSPPSSALTWARKTFGLQKGKSWIPGQNLGTFWVKNCQKKAKKNSAHL